eukprot:5579157-Ditylum_brightwellii.AAC.1
MQEMYKDYNGPKKKHYAIVDKKLYGLEYEEASQIHGHNHVAIPFVKAIETRKASVLKNVPESDESSLQKTSSNKKRLCGVEFNDFEKNQSKHEVDVVKDCSDNNKTRLTIITRESESNIT